MRTPTSMASHPVGRTSTLSRKGSRRPERTLAPILDPMQHPEVIRRKTAKTCHICGAKHGGTYGHERCEDCFAVDQDWVDRVYRSLNG
jgi:hypothetical protein